MATMLGFIVLVTVTSHFAPHLSRRDIFFGVTVAPDFRDGPIGRRVSRRYAAEVWFMAFVAAALVVTSPMPLMSASLLLGQTVGAVVAFIRAQRSVTPHAVAPGTIREAEIGPRPGLPGGFAAQVGPFLILLFAAAYVAWFWEDVPARIPIHWNLSGRPDNWTTKSVVSISAVLALALVINGMGLFMSYAVLHWSRLPSVGGAAGRQDSRIRQINLTATLAMRYLVAFLFAWLLIMPTLSDQSGQLQLPLALRVAPFILVVVGTLVVRVMRRTAAAHGPHVGDSTPDARWMFGKLYINRADPALFVAKRMGLGYTLNLGNPWSWLVMIVFVTGIAIPLLLIP